MQKIISVCFNKNSDSFKDNSFNFMRIILAFAVIYSHSFELLGEGAPCIFGRSLGNFAVHCFFALSGYFIMYSWRNSKSSIEYAVKRVLRILPEYVVAMLLSECLALLCQDYSICPTPFIRNGVVWTLYYEILAYIIVLILGFFKCDNKNTIGALWGCSLLLIIVFQNSIETTYTVIAPLFFMFISGMYLCVNDNLNIKSGGVVAVIMLVIVNFFSDFFPFIMKGLPLIYGPDMSRINTYIFLLCLPIAIIFLGKELRCKCVVKTDISYGIYIYAWPIQQSLIFFCIQQGFELKASYIFCISSVITLIISATSYWIIEKPMTIIRTKMLMFVNKVTRYGQQ